MPHLTTDDGIRLFYEEAGSGTPIIFVHEFAGDHRSYEPQLRYFSRRYRAIALDVGDQDSLKTDTGKLHDAMDNYGIANSFEIYSGTHTSNVAVRFQDYVMPFFSKTLAFGPPAP